MKQSQNLTQYSMQQPAQSTRRFVAWQSNYKPPIRQKQLELCISLGVGLLLAICLLTAQSMACFANVCKEVRDDTLRLHIQANSNTVQDQTLKLQVRDACLALMETIYPKEEEITKEEAIARATAMLPQFRWAANEVLARAGVTQEVNVYFTQMEFDTTAYDAFTLPAGEYTALRIELGAHQGKNWWCVLYPALCLSSAEAKYQTPEENALVVGEYQIAFASVAFFEKISEKLS